MPAETEEEGAGDAETEKDVTGAEIEQSQYTQEQSDMNQSASKEYVCSLTFSCVLD